MLLEPDPLAKITDWDGLCEGIFGTKPLKFSPELLPGTVELLLIGGKSSSSSMTTGSPFYPVFYLSIFILSKMLVSSD